MDISRPLSDVEKREYSPVGAKTGNDIFLAQLAEISAKFVKEHKPFDGQCARLDFQDEVSRVEKESERMHGYVRAEDINGMKFDNLEKYGDIKRFEEAGVDEELEMQVVTIGGMNVKKNVVSGYTVQYKCKERGHGCSVFMTRDEYEESFGKDTVIEKEEK